MLGLFFFIFDVASHQEDEVAADRALLRRKRAGLVVERRSAQTLLALLQPAKLDDDHLLAQGVALLIGRHFEPFERHLSRPGHLDEKRVGRSGASGPGTLIASRQPIDK